MRLLWFAVAQVMACSSGSRTIVTEAVPAAGSQVSTTETRPAPTAPVPCTVVRVEAGADRETVCPADVHLPSVVLDLRDGWTPSLFAPGPDGVAPGFRASYLAMAAEHDANGKPLTDDAHGALGELYGVLPSLAIVRERLGDEARHKCHAQIDSSAIKLLERPFGQEHGGGIKANDQTRIFLAAQLERERVRRKLPDVAALATDPKLQPTYERWKKLDLQHAGLVAAERHLVCEGFLSDADADGNVTWKVGNAIELYQRRNFLMPNERFDVETREAMVTESRELDFRFALRVLRERVVDATGLIEDGTAGDGPRPILGRMLDPAAMRTARGHEQPLPNAAPDLISVTTEAAARQLGWTGPAETLAFLDRHRTGVVVAIALPPPPAYHATHMALSAEVDRGDVWYDDAPVFRPWGRRPNLVLSVDDHGTRRPLVRWPTTIGGWADVRTAGGGIVQRWKESDVGPRVWRDIFAAPTWLPPPATPDRDLVRDKPGGGWELKTSIMGPGPRAAYGMVLIEHYQVQKQKDGTERFDDNGIGTHGSASVTSIVNGNSHGCHRLYNQLADFLLRHRDHVAKGEQQEHWRRVVHYMGTFPAKIDTRGFLYELTPPVAVNVLPGNIRSQRKRPPLSWAPARP
jgi:hypothetical protein